MTPTVLLALPRYRGINHGLFLGIATLAASLKQASITVAVLDEDVAASAERIEGINIDETIKRVIDTVRPSIIGVHVNTPNYASALRLISKLRTLSNAPIVAGGPHATVAADTLLTLHPEIDFVLRGEADNSLPALVKAVTKGDSLEHISGITYRVRDKLVHNPAAELISAFDLGLPDRESLIYPPDSVLCRHTKTTYARNFYSAIPGFEGRSVTSAYVSRGCNASCRFCFPTVFWAQPDGKAVRRIRPANQLREEIYKLRDLGYGAVFFDEPTFPIGSQPAWLKNFLSIMQEFDMLWGAPTRLEEIDIQLVPQLAANGLRYLYYGQESPHHHIQRSLEKVFNAARTKEIISALNLNGIQCDASIFFGAPGESDETINTTINWLDNNFPQGNAFFSIAAFWPGTPWANKIGLFPECWEPNFDRAKALKLGAIWYPEDNISIDRFYSNSTGTYHPKFMTIERVLSIKERILATGFRDRFGRYARATNLR